MMLVPLTAFQRDIPLPPPATPTTVTRLLLSPAAPGLSAQARQEAIEILGRSHGFDPADLGALNVWDTTYEAGLFAEMFSGLGRFFITVGLTTLALGILGVMNVTLVTVSETIREIGVRRAIGATRKQILASYLSESLLLTLASGAVGVVVAFGAVGLLGLLRLPEALGHPAIPATAVVLVVSSLAVGGAAAGLYPALRAGAVDVLTALREE
jgi:putative ABC transport system permease protein